jgi:hypothetical protein
VGGGKHGGSTSMFEVAAQGVGSEEQPNSDPQSR